MKNNKNKYKDKVKFFNENVNKLNRRLENGDIKIRKVDADKYEFGTDWQWNFDNNEESEE